MGEEILYPMDLIRRTVRAVLFNEEPTTIDQVIEFTDLRRTFVRLPKQYQHVLGLWLEFDGDRTSIAMVMGREEEDVSVVLKSAWKYLSDLLNGDP